MNWSLTKILPGIFVLIILSIQASCNNSQPLSDIKTDQVCYSSHVVDKVKQPSKNLLALLELLQISHDESLGDIVAKTQKTWLRPAGVERFHMQDFYINKKEMVTPLLHALGLINTVMPTKKHYSYALIHGATIKSVRGRIAFLVNLYKQGVHFDTIVLLSGQRMLDPIIENINELCNNNQTILPIQANWQCPASENMPKTEVAMMQFIFEQADLPIEMKNCKLVIIDAKQQKNKDGSFRRPNTEDTINTWLAKNPIPGDCLAISHQPFIGYQDSIANTCLPSTFPIETVGFTLSEEHFSVSVCLDSLARWLYQINKT